MKQSDGARSRLQLIWGVALTIVGIAVFFRIPQVMPQLAQMGQSPTALVFIRICFYILGMILLGGGVKKIVHYFRQQAVRPSADSADEKH